MNNGIVKAREAAPFIGTTVGNLSQMRHEGKGPRYVLVGTAIRYRISDLEEYLNARTVDPAKGPAPGMARHPGGPGRGRKGPRRKMQPERGKRARRAA